MAFWQGAGSDDRLRSGGQAGSRSHPVPQDPALTVQLRHLVSGAPRPGISHVWVVSCQETGRSVPSAAPPPPPTHPLPAAGTLLSHSPHPQPTRRPTPTRSCPCHLSARPHRPSQRPPPPCPLDAPGGPAALIPIHLQPATPAPSAPPARVSTSQPAAASANSPPCTHPPMFHPPALSAPRRPPPPPRPAVPQPPRHVPVCPPPRQASLSYTVWEGEKENSVRDSCTEGEGPGAPKVTVSSFLGQGSWQRPHHAPSTAHCSQGPRASGRLAALAPTRHARSWVSLGSQTLTAF